MGWSDLLQREIWGNSAQAWTISLALVMAVTIGLRAAARVLLKRVAALAAMTQTGLDDLAVELLDKTRTVAILLVAVWAAARPLTLEPAAEARVVREQERTRFDRSHLKSLASHSIDFETVYYLTVPDYEAYMDVQQAVNLALIEAFAEKGIEFAFPTQTLYMVGAGGAGNGAEWVEGALRGGGIQDSAG
jgi:hypothetical protein